MSDIMEYGEKSKNMVNAMANLLEFFIHLRLLKASQGITHAGGVCIANKLGKGIEKE